MPRCMLVVPATWEAKAEGQLRHRSLRLAWILKALSQSKKRNTFHFKEIDLPANLSSAPVISTSAMILSHFKSIAALQGSAVAPSADMPAQPYSTTD